MNILVADVRKCLIALLAVCTWAFAWAGIDVSETVVASDEKVVWLGPDEIVVASGEVEFALMPSAPLVTAITAQPRNPWDGKVDVVVTFEGASNDVAQIEYMFVATNSATKTALSVEHVTPMGEVTGGGTTWTRRFVWDAATDVGAARIDDVALSVLVGMPDGVQLWEDGPYWAECNVGATKPEENGYYFWWGDTVGYTREGGTWTADDYYSGVTWVSSTGTRMSSSPFSRSSCPTYNGSNSWLQERGYTDATGNLVAEHDAATAHLGAPWRMPTSAEIDALISNCTTTWTTRNGVYGRLVTGRGAYASKSIFLPAAGYCKDSDLLNPGPDGCYWSSTRRSRLFFDPGRFCRMDFEHFHGLPIRALRGSSTASSASSLTTHLALVPQYVVTFDANGGSSSSSQTFDHGLALGALPQATRTGYTFTGWYTASSGGTQVTASTVVTANVTYYAHWTANSYSVKFNANGGTGTMADQKLTYDTATNLTANAFTWTGYTFKGWATSASGAVAYADQASVKNLTATAGGTVDLYAVWEMAEVARPAISPVDGTVFTTPSCTVSITCPAEGAAIYYSTNGRTPRVNETYRYHGPFTITDTTTVLAFAVWGEMESELVEATITKGEPEPLTLKRVLDEAKLGEVTTGGDAEWTPLEDVSAKEGGAFARSGAIGAEQTTWMETTVSGRGTLTFWWKTSCEADPRGRYTYDHIVFAVDGETRARLDGETDWRQVSVTFESDESHVLRWTYSTDDWEEPGYQDCAWVDGVAWSGQAAPSVDATQTTAVPVPFAWLREKYPELNEVAAFESKAKAKAANGVNTVMEAYVAGFDPRDKQGEFQALIKMVEGKPVVTWRPVLPEAEAAKRVYTTYGKESMDGSWVDLAKQNDAAKAKCRFFKVGVWMK